MKTHYSLPTTHYSLKRGMTALEIVIALAIVIMVGALIMVPFVRFKNEQILASATEQVVSALREARAETLAAKNDTVHGVHFEEGRFVVFETSWSEGALLNVVTNFQHPVYLATTTFAGGGSDVMFARLSGKTYQAGTLVLQLRGYTNTQTIITIDPSGSVSVDR